MVGDARALPFEVGSFHAAFASFTLELFALAEIARVSKPDGRIGIVHGHGLPHTVDRLPIDVAKLAGDARFEIRSEPDREIWTIPVRAVFGSLRNKN